jgi:uncharacterized membrane protein
VSDELMRMNHQRSRWHIWMAVFDLALLAVTALLALLLLRGVDGLPRLLATLAFACLVPGGALVTRLPFRQPDEILAMTVALSLAILAAASLLMAWLGVWHPLWLTAELAAPAVVLLTIDLLGHLFLTGTDDLR